MRSFLAGAYLSPSPLLFLVPVLVLRAHALSRDFFWAPAPEFLLLAIRGVGSEAAAALALGIIAHAICRAAPVYWGLWVAWIFAVLLNDDHIQINDAHADYLNARWALEPSFLFGAIFSWDNLRPLIALQGLTLLAIWSLHGLRIAAVASVRASALMLSMALLATLLVPTSAAMPRWIQMGPVEDNVRRLFVRESGRPVPDPPSVAERDRFFGTDLSGVPWTDFPDRPPNVLLVVLENVSAQVAFGGQMPYFEQRVQAHASWTNFLSVQRQSNRGIYALMCGDYPNFISHEAKADVIAEHGADRTCLPRMLSRAGFRTRYLQANSIGFMQMGAFTQNIGFDEARGKADYAGALIETNWAVADADLFRFALTETGELAASPGPWFVTVHTGGTHYPYTVPGVSSPSYADAVASLDASLKSFIDALDGAGVLDTTLVLITSDEAATAGGRGIARLLGQNQVPLVALMPGVSGGKALGGLFTQRDLQLSLADYLGLEGGSAAGRSLFRTYERPPDVLFGNVYQGQRYALLSGTRLYRQARHQGVWRAYSVSEQGLFADAPDAAVPDAQVSSLLERVFAFNERGFPKDDRQVMFQLTDTELTGFRYLLGDLRASVAPGDRIAWRLDLDAVAPVRVWLHMEFHDDAIQGAGAAPSITREQLCEPGATCRFGYEHVIESGVSSVRISAAITPLRNESYVVREMTLARRREPD